MYSIDLDISHEAKPSSVTAFAENHNCIAELLVKNGPAGGNLLYKFSSENSDNIVHLLKTYYNNDMMDIEEYMNMIEEV